MATDTANTDHLGQIIKDVKGELSQNTLEKFTRLGSNEERFQFVWNLTSVHRILGVRTCRKKKNPDLAEVARKTGNSFFQEKKFRESIEQYNKSIINAPVSIEDDCEQLTLSVANRSASLYHLKQYRLCIEDIEYALEMGYPERLRYKLYDRLGKCYSDLKERSNACGYFKKALECLSASDLNDKGKELWSNSLKKQLRVAENLQVQENEVGIRRNIKVVPGIEISRHPQYPCASNALKIQYAKGRGRFVVASQDIEVGDVLVVEKAYTSVLICDHLDTHCNHCLARTVIPYPCHHCTSVRYCSSACQHEAWERYHYAECVLLGWLTEQWMGQMNYLAIRSTIVTGLENVMKIYRQGSGNDCEKPKGLYDVSFDRVWNLVDHTDDHSSEELFQLTVVAVLSVKLLQLTDFWPDANKDLAVTSESIILQIGCSIMKLFCICQCNAFNIAEIQMQEDLRLCKPKDVGIGLYPTSALINHSCCPNIDCNYFGDVSVYRAIQNIKAGEEINVDYGYVFYTNPAPERQFKLSQQYFFKCQCLACREGWPLAEDLNSTKPTFLCCNCSAQLNAASMCSPCVCKQCGSTCDVKAYLQKLQASHTSFAAAMENAMDGRHREALPVLQKHLSLVQSYIANPWRDFFSCQATIKQCYRIMGNNSNDNTFRSWQTL